MFHQTLTILLASTLIFACQDSSGKKNSDPSPEKSPEPEPPQPEEGGVNLVGIDTVSRDSAWKLYGELQQVVKDGSMTFTNPKEASLYFTLLLRKHTKSMPTAANIKRAFALYFLEDNKTLRPYASESELRERAASRAFVTHASAL